MNNTTATRNPLILHNFADVNLSAYIAAQTPYFTKAGSANLTLNYQQFYNGGTAINGGYVTLASTMTNSVVNNPLPILPGKAWFQPYDLWVNSGTLDMMDKNQVVLNLRSTNPLPGSGGVLTNSSTGTSIISVAANAASTFAGSLTGNLSLIKAGGSQLTLTGPATYTGFTTVAGSTLELKDLATIRNSKTVNVNYGTLYLNNQGTYGNIKDRLSTDAVVNLRGGALTVIGVQGGTSTQALGTVNALEGFNTITATSGQFGVTDITINNFNRSTFGGTMSFTGLYNFGNLSTDPQGYGTDLNVGHIFLQKLNDQPVTLTNSIIGGWAIAGTQYNSRFATYNPDLGVGYLTQQGFANQSSVGNALQCRAHRQPGRCAVPGSHQSHDQLVASGRRRRHGQPQ